MSRINSCLKFSGISLATLAASLVVMPQCATAQSFLGTPTVQFGSASITTGPATTNIVVDSPRAVINWDLAAPSGGGPVIFQPADTVANFFSSPAVSYVVLNRILPTDLTRAVQFDGTVNADGNNGVFFYSPGGIVVGSTATFNVGRLLLTTNEVAVDGNGGFFFANDLNLTAATGSTSAVSILPGARINALAEGSFVLAVAPRVFDAGTTVVNGTKALIASEAVDLTYNAGLFDISVTQGTEATGEVLRHDGSTTGPASSGSGDFHRAYMVAVPKSAAIRMFVSGVNGLGFDIAGAADVVGNAIILSGGSNITEAGSGTGNADPFAPAPVNNIATEIQIAQGNYTSYVNARSNDRAIVAATQPGNMNFANSLIVRAPSEASLNASNGSVTVTNDLQLSADAVSLIANSSDQQGGTASITVGGTGNSLTVGGFTTVSANGVGADAPAASGGVNGGTGRGGNTFVNVTAGATFNANGGYRVQANGIGGAGTLGGDGIGGNANVTSSNSALQSVGGYAVNADGTGGEGTQRGGNGAGGAASTHAEGPTGLIDVSIADGFFVTATGQGGNGTDSISGTGGTGTGGAVVVRATNGGNLNVDAIQSRVDASALGGFGFVGGGGAATGGNAGLTIFGGGAIRFTRPGSEVRVNSFAVGGDGNPGGTANAGTSTVSIDTGGTLQVESDNFVVNAAATGGASTLFDGGRAVAGNAIVGLAGTATFTGAALIDAQGRGGAGANSAAGGAGIGGNAQINSSGTSTFSSTLTAIADGTGGDGLTGGAGTAGNAPGASIFINGGTMSVAGAASITAQGTGGASTGFGTGGSGNGGNAGLTVVTGGTGIFSSSLDVSGAGAGGAGRDGGNAAAGTVDIVARGGSLSITGASNLNAAGTGGNAAAGLGGIGGNGTGGSVSFTANNTATNATLNAAAVNATARGVGGAGGSASAALVALGLPGVGGNGGNGRGGSVVVGSTNSAGNIILGAVNANGAGGGGAGGAGGAFGPGGNGGNATGGEVRVGFGNTSVAATGTMRAASVLASTSSLAGSGGTGTAFGNGGDGFGGNTILGNTVGGAFSVTGAATAAANGAGGFGAAIGMGSGGNAIILTGPNPNAPAASNFIAGSANVQAAGFRQALVGGSPVIQPTGRFGRAVIFANGGRISLGATSILATGSAGQTTVPAILGLVNSGLMARNARLLITNNFNGLFASNAALGTDGGNIDFVGPVGSGFTFTTPANIVDTLTGTAPAGQGQVTSNTFLNINAGGNILTPNSTYVSQLTANIVAGGNLFAGGVSAGEYLFLQSGGNMNVGGILGGDVLEAISGGTMTFGNIRADSDVDLTAAGAVTTGTISSGDTVTIGSGGTITTGNIDAGINNPSADPAAAYAVGLRGLGNVTTGSINAVNRIGIGSDTGTISTGAINTGEFFLALADTGVTVNGGMTTGTGANGITYIADASMLALIDPVTLDPAPVFNAAPVRTGGPIVITGAVNTGRFAAATSGTFAASGNISASNSDTATTQALFISAGGNVTTQDLTATAGSININGDASITSGNINGLTNVTLIGTGAINSGNVISGGSVRFETLGAVNAGNVQASSDIDLSSDVSVTTGTINGNGRFAVNTVGNIVTSAIDVEDEISLISVNGSIATGAANTSQYFLALANGSVTVSGGITTGTGANGVTYIADSSMQGLIDPVTLDPTPIFNAAPVATGGPIAIAGPVTTGRFAAATNGAFTAGQAINANTSALISSGGLATFNGIVNAPIITVTSNGLDIGTNGGLGSSTTTALNINAGVGAGQIRLGGNAGTGYVIDANEMARLRAQNIRFRTSGTAAPLLTIGSFTMQGSAGASPNLIGGSGAFTIETNGSVRVIGTAAIDGAAAGNALSINAGGRIDVITDQGGAIQLSNAAGDPDGILNLSAGTIASATGGLIDQLTQNANFAGRDEALDAAAVIPVPQGYVGAGTMNVRVSNGFFVQNSNTSQLRAGFNVGAGGLSVAPIAGTTTPIEMIVNGRAVQAGGIFLTNQNTRDAATFDPLSAFAPTAKLNGCLISAAFCASFGGDALAFIGTQQGNAVQHQQEDREEGEFAYTLPIVLIDSLVSDPASEEQIRITEPVTGSGNSEVWSKPEGEAP